MKILAVTPAAITEVVNVIRSGGTVAHATETCYGFACDLTNEDAVRKLFTLKQRPLDQPVSALFVSVEEAKKWVEWGDVAEELAGKHLPGPLTIVVGLGTKDEGRRTRDEGQRIHVIPLSLSPCPMSSSLGVRISSHPIAMEIAKQCGVPLSTTSANLHGKPNPYSVEEIVAQYEDQDPKPDLILDSGRLPEASPSTVIAVSNGTMCIVRQGSILCPNP